MLLPHRPTSSHLGHRWCKRQRSHCRDCRKKHGEEMHRLPASIPLYASLQYHFLEMPKSSEAASWRKRLAALRYGNQAHTYRCLAHVASSGRGEKAVGPGLERCLLPLHQRQKVAPRNNAYSAYKALPLVRSTLIKLHRIIECGRR